MQIICKPLKLKHMCFSSNPCVANESHIYLMRKVIMKIEFLSNALANQITQPKLRLLLIRIKSKFFP